MIQKACIHLAKNDKPISGVSPAFRWREVLGQSVRVLPRRTRGQRRRAVAGRTAWSVVGRFFELCWVLKPGLKGCLECPGNPHDVRRLFYHLWWPGVRLREGASKLGIRYHIKPWAVLLCKLYANIRVSLLIGRLDIWMNNLRHYWQAHFWHFRCGLFVSSGIWFQLGVLRFESTVHRTICG